MSSVLVVLKTQDSEVPPNAVLAGIEEHIPEGPGIAILLDVSRLFQDQYGARAYAIIDGQVIRRLSCAVVAEREE